MSGKSYHMMYGAGMDGKYAVCYNNRTIATFPREYRDEVEKVVDELHKVDQSQFGNMDTTKDQVIADYMAGVIGIVEADGFARMQLWKNQQEYNYTFESARAGYGCEVGRIGNRPIYLDLLTAELNGHKILLWNATSQLVDHKMIEQWFEANLPDSAFKPNYNGREGRHVNSTDASNFTNVLPRNQHVEQPSVLD